MGNGFMRQAVAALIALLVVLVSVPAAHAAITVDGTVSTGTTATNTMTISHTTSGIDRLMIVGVSINNNNEETVLSVKYNGDALTPLTAYMDSDDAYAQIWYRVAPDVGTYNVVITFSADLLEAATGGVITFNGVDQVTPLGPVTGNDGTSLTASVPGVVSDVGELVIDTVAGETCGSLTATSPQIEGWDLHNGSSDWGGGSTKDGAASVDMSWTLGSSDHWAITAVSIKPATGVTTHTITAMSGPGGSISPTGDVTVNEGNDQGFTITPDGG